MKKLLLAFIVASSIVSITNSKTDDKILNRCQILKKMRAAAIKKLQELDKQAEEGDLASAEALYVAYGFCNGRSYYVWGKTKEKLREFDFVDAEGTGSRIFCDCISDEVYQECKEVFEADENENKSQE